MASTDLTDKLEACNDRTMTTVVQELENLSNEIQSVSMSVGSSLLLDHRSIRNRVTSTIVTVARALNIYSAEGGAFLTSVNSDVCLYDQDVTVILYQLPTVLYPMKEFVTVFDMTITTIQ